MPRSKQRTALEREIREEVRGLMAEHRVSQKLLAEATGIGTDRVNRIVNGNERASFDTWQALRDALNLKE